MFLKTASAIRGELPCEISFPVSEGLFMAALTLPLSGLRHISLPLIQINQRQIRRQM